MIDPTNLSHFPLAIFSDHSVVMNFSLVRLTHSKTFSFFS